ncbi:MAG: hypothetical protein KGI38_09190 [Thaumarchaeota archaeon]|nr:hypothetical protein [Nitrososphaerota archaeon]
MTANPASHCNVSLVINAQTTFLHADRSPFVKRDLRALKQTARSLLPPDSISLRMIESQEDLLPDERARVVVPMLARMVWEEFRERRPSAS